ncbi:hypothetical protein PR048_014019, partial [Dryococelus australis]
MRLKAERHTPKGEEIACKETCIAAERDCAAMATDWGHDYLPKESHDAASLCINAEAALESAMEQGHTYRDSWLGCLNRLSGQCRRGKDGTRVERWFPTTSPSQRHSLEVLKPQNIYKNKEDNHDSENSGNWDKSTMDLKAAAEGEGSLSQEIPLSQSIETATVKETAQTTAEAVQGEASTTVEEITEYATCKCRKVNKEWSNFLLPRVMRLKALLEPQIVRSAQLEGETRVYKTLERTSTAAIEKPTIKAKTQSFADTVKEQKKAKEMPQEYQWQEVRGRRQPSKRTILVYPTEGEGRSEETNIKLKSPDPAEDEQTILNMKNAKRMEELGLRVADPKNRGPKVINYDVPREYDGPEFMETLRLQKFRAAQLSEELKKNVSVRFRTGPRDKEVVNLVLEVTPPLRRLLIDCGTLFIGFQRCKIRDYVMPTQCYKCQGYGHIKEKSKGELVCPHCSETGHKFSECKVKAAKPKCANCTRDKTEMAPTQLVPPTVRSHALLRLGQINLQRAAVPTMELHKIVIEQKLDLVLMQEPYLLRGKVPTLPGRFAIFGENPLAGIWVCNPEIDFVPLEALSNTHHVCNRLVTGEGCGMTIVSSYFQLKDPIEVHLSQWENILTRANDPRIILGADINAKSELWNSPRTDDQGRRADKIGEMVIAACYRAVPKTQRMVPHHPWWVDDLERNHRQVKCLHKRFKRMYRPDLRQQAVQQYNIVRTQYRRLLRKKRQTAWRELVTDRGNQDSWGIGLSNEPEEITRHLLEKILPDDTAVGETAYHERVRAEQLSPMETENTAPSSLKDLDATVRQTNLRKAPGKDGMTGEILLRAYPRIHHDMLELFNDCLSGGKFPSGWKGGHLIVIYKGAGRNQRKANSYMPITLLPEMGKTLEHLLNQRLMQYLDIIQRINPRQYGFTKGKSTEMAIIDMVEQVKTYDQTYDMAVSLDIVGAFDNTWWPQILWQLRLLECPRNIYGMIRSFMTNRKCFLEMGAHKEEKCLLRLDLPHGCMVYGYADYSLLLVPAWSWRELEENTDIALTMVEEWGGRFKLDISVENINAILLKGTLKRNPVIRFGGRVIRMVTEMKYIGVILESPVMMFHRLRAVAPTNWGLEYRTLKLMYKSVFLPILTYVCGVWYPEAERVHGKRAINSAQRAAMLGITKAYRTTSGDALQLIAGEIPLDLLVVQMGTISHRRKRGVIPTAEWREMKEAKLTARQTRWDLRVKGRLTHGLFPCVRERLRLEKWLEVGHYTAQFLTGYGNFHAKLSSLGMVEDPLCVVCGKEDTSTHALKCPKIEEIRLEFEGNQGPLCLGPMLRDRDKMACLLQHLTRVGKRREEFDVWWSGPRLSMDLDLQEVNNGREETGIEVEIHNGVARVTCNMSKLKRDNRRRTVCAMSRAREVWSTGVPMEEVRSEQPRCIEAEREVFLHKVLMGKSLATPEEAWPAHADPNDPQWLYNYLIRGAMLTKLENLMTLTSALALVIRNMEGGDKVLFPRMATVDRLVVAQAGLPTKPTELVTLIKECFWRRGERFVMTPTKEELAWCRKIFLLAWAQDNGTIEKWIHDCYAKHERIITDLMAAAESEVSLPQGTPMSQSPETETVKETSRSPVGKGPPLGFDGTGNGQSLITQLTAKTVQGEASTTVEEIIGYATCERRKANKKWANFLLPHVMRLKALLDLQIVRSTQLEVPTERVTVKANKSQSFAEIVKEQKKAKEMPQENQWQEVNGCRQPAKRTILVYPKEGEYQSEETKAKLKTLDLVKEQLLIKNVHQVSKGDVLLEAEDEQTLLKLRNAQRMEELGQRVADPKKRRPKFIIYDVLREYDGPEFMETLRPQIFSAAQITDEEVRKNASVCFRTGPRDREVVNLVLEVTPPLRKLLIDCGTLFIGFQRCKVRDYVMPTRCYKCQGYGHIKEKCKGQFVCPHCSEKGHKFSECKVKDAMPKCANCVRDKHRDCFHPVGPSMTSSRELLWLGQINLQRSAVPTMELHKIVKEKHLEWVLMQEPYLLRGKVPTLSGHFYLFGENPLAGIWVCNPKKNYVPLEALSNMHHACIPNDPKIILGADINAKSELWHSPRTDGWGEEVKRYLKEKALQVVNRPGHEANYVSPAHDTESYLDITVATACAAGSIGDWRVMDEVDSDHKMIRLTIQINGIRQTREERPCFVMAKADWPLFDRVLQGYLIKYRVEKLLMSVDQWADKIEQYGVQQYNVARAQYWRLLRMKRQVAWRELVSYRGNQDPWGLVYRMVTGKVRGTEVLPALKSDDHLLQRPEEITRHLLEKLLPDDTAVGETEYHERIRAEQLCPIETEHTAPFSLNDLDAIVRRTKLRKAPRCDGMMGEILLRAYPRIHHDMLELFNDCLSEGKFPLGKANSYTPITLLPVMGKTLEGLVNQRLIQYLDIVQSTHPHQYGFMKGKSTEMAIIDMVEQILWQLRLLEYPGNIYGLIESFLTDCKSTLEMGSYIEEKVQTKGCLQGLVLGPILWNVIFEGLLRLDFPQGCEVYGYVDVGLLLVPAWSCKELEEKPDLARIGKRREEFDVWWSGPRLSRDLDMSEVDNGKDETGVDVVNLNGKPHLPMEKVLKSENHLNGRVHGVKWCLCGNALLVLLVTLVSSNAITDEEQYVPYPDPGVPVEEVRTDLPRNTEAEREVFLHKVLMRKSMATPEEAKTIDIDWQDEKSMFDATVQVWAAQSYPSDPQWLYNEQISGAMLTKLEDPITVLFPKMETMDRLVVAQAGLPTKPAELVTLIKKCFWCRGEIFDESNALHDANLTYGRHTFDYCKPFKGCDMPLPRERPGRVEEGSGRNDRRVHELSIWNGADSRKWQTEFLPIEPPTIWPDEYMPIKSIPETTLPDIPPNLVLHNPGALSREGTYGNTVMLNFKRVMTPSKEGLAWCRKIFPLVWAQEAGTNEKWFQESYAKCERLISNLMAAAEGEGSLPQVTPLSQPPAETEKEKETVQSLVGKGPPPGFDSTNRGQTVISQMMAECEKSQQRMGEPPPPTSNEVEISVGTPDCARCIAGRRDKGLQKYGSYYLRTHREDNNQAKEKPQQNKSQEVRGRRHPMKRTVLVYSRERECHSEETKAKFKSLDPVKEQLRIKNVRQVSKDGVLLEAEDEETVLKLRNAQRMEELGLWVADPKKRSPKVIKYDVPCEYDSPEFMETLHLNFRAAEISDEEVRKNAKVRFHTGSRDKDVVNLVLEINLQSAVIPIMELHKIVKEQHLDLVLMLKHYLLRGKVPTLQGRFPLFGENPLPGIWPQDPIEQHLVQWENILTRVNDPKIILGADKNANAELWNSPRTDGLAEEVIRYLIEKALQVVNRAEHEATYVSPAHDTESYLDVTVANAPKADWPLFDRVLLKYLNKHRGEKKFMSLDQQADKIDEMVMAACDRAIPTTQRKMPHHPWWDDELEQNRRQVKCLRKRFKRTYRPDLIQHAVQHYNVARARYWRILRKKRQIAWRELVLDRGNQDPWVLVYQMVTGKIRGSEVLPALESDDHLLQTPEEITWHLLRKLLPNDTNDTVQCPIDMDNTAPFSLKHLDAIVRRIKLRKALGCDGMMEEMLLRAYPRIRHDMLEMFNVCLFEGKFPSGWKKGLLIVIHKGAGKNPRKANSYRSITLLPVMGKSLDRLVNQRLMQYLDIVHGIHPHQYEFMKGKTTEMAVVIMVDQILWQLRLLECPGNIYGLIKSFLTDRKCALEMGSHKEENMLTKGCPQGSGCEVYGYTDHGFLLVPVWSRKELEEKTDMALSMVEDWAERFKMDLSVEKINAILLKVNLKRNPVIRVMGRVIRMVTEIKYLGVILESRQAFHAHVRYAVNKAVTMFHLLRVVAHRLRLEKCLNFEHYSVQYLTCHGNFCAKLSSLGLVENLMCAVCGMEDTYTHVLECPKVENQRIAFEVTHGHLRLRGMLRDRNTIRTLPRLSRDLDMSEVDRGKDETGVDANSLCHIPSQRGMVNGVPMEEVRTNQPWKTEVEREVILHKVLTRKSMATPEEMKALDNDWSDDKNMVDAAGSDLDEVGRPNNVDICSCPCNMECGGGTGSFSQKWIQWTGLSSPRQACQPNLHSWDLSGWREDLGAKIDESRNSRSGMEQTRNRKNGFLPIEPPATWPVKILDKTFPAKTSPQSKALAFSTNYDKPQPETQSLEVKNLLNYSVKMATEGQVAGNELLSVPGASLQALHAVTQLKNMEMGKALYYAQSLIDDDTSWSQVMTPSKEELPLSRKVFTLILAKEVRIIEKWLQECYAKCERLITNPMAAAEGEGNLPRGTPLSQPTVETEKYKEIVQNQVGKGPPPGFDSIRMGQTVAKQMTAECVKGEASLTGQEIIEYASCEKRKLNKERANYIRPRFFRLKALLDLQIVRSAQLEGETNAYKSMGHATLRSAEKAAAKVNKSQSFTEIVKEQRQAKEKPQENQWQEVRGQRQSPKRTVLVYPREGECHSEETRAQLKSLNPVKEQLHINNVHQVSKGVVLLEAEDEETLLNLRNAQRMEELGLRAADPIRRGPKVIIYDISREYDGPEFMETLLLQNFRAAQISDEEVRKNATVHFRTRPRDKDVVNLVLEQAVQQYNVARAQYRRILRKKRQTAWRELVTDRGIQDPWGLVYQRVTTGETEYHERIRAAQLSPIFTNNTAPFSLKDLDVIVRKTKLRKAPGCDGMIGEMLLRAYRRICHDMLDLFNDCLSEGKFPSGWKKSLLIVIYKGAEKNPRKANSYMPIMLLPVMGKTLEHLINQILIQYLDIVHCIHPCQYGFMKGNSTDMAIVNMVYQVKTYDHTYIMAISLDIAGAFDNAWWPQILWQLRLLKCPKNIYEFIKAFSTNRKCALEMGSHREEKVLTKGCLQGSVHGPILWNVIFEGLLRLEFPQGCEVYGYVDDGMLRVPAWSWKELEEKTDQALSMIEEWAERFKMDLSNPVFRFRGRVIRMITEMNYLVVILECRLAFHAHVRYAMNKTITMFNRLRAVAPAKWGLGYRTLKLMYMSVFLPILMCVCGVWYPEVERVHGKRTINSAQRAALLGITKAYRINFQRRSPAYSWGDPSGSASGTDGSWKTRWDLSNKGRLTHCLFPCVWERLRLEKWLEMGHYSIEYLTGHGHFCEKLSSLGLVEDP